jgi:4-amino-4-deoxy-L-arabinose transferase-like glycosyltransferase
MKLSQETTTSLWNKTTVMVAGAALLIFLFFVHTHGYPTQDESWFLQAASRMNNGEVPYVDFQFIYHPAGIYLNLLGFKLFGVSVFASRMMALVNTVIAVIAIWWLAKILQLSKTITVCAIIFFVVWGAVHINFVWPVMLCLTTGLLANAVFTQQSLTKQFSTKQFFIGGVLVGLTLLFKQNFGVAIGLATLLFFLFNEWLFDSKKVMFICLGFASVILLQAIIFAVTGSFGAYLEDMRYLLLEKVIGEGVLNSELPWQYPAPLIIQAIKVVFYVLPLLIGVCTAIVLWQRKLLTQLYLPLLSICYYLLSIRPTTDSIHLVPLLALSGICLGLLHQAVKSSVVRGVVVLVFITMSLFGAYHGLIKNYYRWDMPLVDQNYFWNEQSAQLWINPGIADRDEEIKKYFQSHQLSGNELFVYSYAPYYYLLLDRHNPTRYDYLHTGVLNNKIETEITGILDERSLPYVLTNASLFGDTTQIAKYIQDNYIQAKKWDDIVVWQRKDLVENFIKE